MNSVKTKKFQLTPKLFAQIGTGLVFKKWWWAFLIPVALLIPGIFYWPAFWWLFGFSILITIIYILFWFLQFYGAQYTPQGKELFARTGYEITPEHLLIGRPALAAGSSGMQRQQQQQQQGLSWSLIQKVERRADGYIFFVGRFQFLYLPVSIFNSDSDIRFMEAMLRRKNLLPKKEETETPKTNIELKPKNKK